MGAQRLLDNALENTFPCSDPVAIGHSEHSGVPSHESDRNAAQEATGRPSVENAKLAARLGIEVWELEILISLHPGAQSSISRDAARLRMRIT